MNLMLDSFVNKPLFITDLDRLYTTINIYFTGKEQEKYESLILRMENSHDFSDCFKKYLIYEHA